MIKKKKRYTLIHCNINKNSHCCLSISTHIYNACTGIHPCVQSRGRGRWKHKVDHPIPLRQFTAVLSSGLTYGSYVGCWEKVWGLSCSFFFLKKGRNGHKEQLWTVLYPSANLSSGLIWPSNRLNDADRGQMSCSVLARTSRRHIQDKVGLIKTSVKCKVDWCIWEPLF